MTVGTLLATNVKSWLSARGFWMVVATALLPLVLTGAWITTHQRDVAVVDVVWDPERPVGGQTVTFTALIQNKGRFDSGAFSFNFSVGHLEQRGNSIAFIADEENHTRMESLAPGEIRAHQLSWTADPGIFVVWAVADAVNDVPELEEFNNERFEAIEIGNEEAPLSDTPRAPGNLHRPSSAVHADAVVENLRWTPELLATGNSTTFTVTVRNNGPDRLENANVSIRAGQVFSGRFTPFVQTTPPKSVSLDAGATTDVTLAWNNLQGGAYWVEAFVNATNAQDPNTTNNYVVRSLVVNDRLPDDFKFPEPGEKVTIKLFYADILGSIMIPLVLPFIALFFGGGVIEDERSRGNLLYLLTRPVPRALLPLMKFAVNFVVAAIAVTVGVVATFFLLLGTPESNIGFLVTPLLISLLTLFVYGAFFILLGVVVERPYIVGLGFIAWEWLVFVGELIQINNNPLVASWVKNLTLSHYLHEVSTGWPLDKGILWYPTGAPAMEALRNISLAAIGFLFVSAIVMKRREFDL